MNQIPVSLSHHREFNQRVSALPWLHLASQEISSWPSHVGVRVGCSGAWDRAAATAGALTLVCQPFAAQSQPPFNITAVGSGHCGRGDIVHAVAI